MNKQEFIKDLYEYKNYLYALQWYKEYDDKYGDKAIIDEYEAKVKELKKDINNAKLNK